MNGYAIIINTTAATGSPPPPTATPPVPTTTPPATSTPPTRTSTLPPIPTRKQTIHKNKTIVNKDIKNKKNRGAIHTQKRGWGREKRNVNKLIKHTETDRLFTATTKKHRSQLNKTHENRLFKTENKRK